jgi:class 3 adenylate cyclase
VTPWLEPGRYRLRTLVLRGGQHLAVTPDGSAEARLVAADEGWPAGELSLGTQPALCLANSTQAEQLFILERMAWSDEAATAAEVTSLQMFRDLFANEALRPAERIAVGSLTVLFTDLRGSTRMYRESGDAVAFGRVMSHFDVLREAIAAEEGAVVKTIGDSVMAVFVRPVRALRAVLQAQAQLEQGLGAGPPLRLKAGIHAGPCVAVNLNERLDYFGSTVNIAARLGHLSGMHPGVIISAAIRRDPEVAAWLDAEQLRAEPFEVSLKGFEGERFEMWAVVPVAALPERQSS